MKPHTHSPLRRPNLWLSALISWLFLTSGLDVKATNPGGDIFPDSSIPEIRLYLAPKDLAQLQQQPRSYVPADFTLGSQRFQSVAVRLKGGFGSKQDLSGKPSLTLRFDKLQPGRLFHGLSKLHLNNSLQDRFYLNEFSATQLFKIVGIPAPRVDHAVVWLNDRPLGIYVAKEGVDSRFLQHHYGSSDGELYQGSPGQDISPRLEQTSGGAAEPRLERLTTALLQPPGSAKEQALENLVDLPAFYSFAATEILASHMDGYCMGPNNYRVWMSSGGARFIPHGMDLASAASSVPSMPTKGARLMQSVLESTRLRAEFRERFRKLIHNDVDPGVFETRMRRVADRLVPVISRWAPVEAERFGEEVDKRVRGLVERLKVLREDLPLNPGRLRRTGEGWEIPDGAWHARPEFGRCEFGQTNLATGGLGLMITVSGRQIRSQGSWRAVVSAEAKRMKLKLEARELWSSQEHRNSPATAWVEVGPGTRQELRLSASLDTKSVEVEMKPTGTEQEITIGYRGNLGKVCMKVTLNEIGR